MRFMNVLLVITILFAAGCAAPNVDQGSDLNEIYARYPDLAGKKHTLAAVKRIVDGDTFELGSGEKVRLIGVNTPEITNGKTEAFGQEAKQFTSQQLLGKTVILFPDTSDTDRYGRLLRYVFVQSESEMFNERLLTEGYANTMTYPPDVMYAETFTELESEARQQEKGLWGEQPEAYTPSCEEPLIKGNINSKGERIYHVPDSRYYESTIAEMMFCTPEDAEEAGFRAPKN